MADVLYVCAGKRKLLFVCLIASLKIFPVEKKIFWIVFIVLGLVADFILPLWWALIATIPIAVLSWWVAYRSEWF